MRRRRSSVRHTLLRSTLAMLAICWCWTSAPALAGEDDCDHRSVQVTYDQDGNRLIVVDGSARTVSLFKVGAMLTHAGSLPLDGPSDTSAARAPIAIPAADLPGDDPPEIVRPAGAVRIRSAYQDGHRERWEATYVVRGDTLAVFESMLAGFDGWVMTKRDVGLDARRGTSFARFSAKRGTYDADVDVDPRLPVPEGWSAVRVSVTRLR